MFQKSQHLHHNGDPSGVFRLQRVPGCVSLPAVLLNCRWPWLKSYRGRPQATWKCGIRTDWNFSVCVLYASSIPGAVLVSLGSAHVRHVGGGHVLNHVIGIAVDGYHSVACRHNQQ